ncbi:MAG TPA: universal stress protein [Vicinamibacterales bacterium]|jgi:nucleotide-binding universal stress UspA family protein
MANGIERILLPTDFSDTAAVAMDYACELASAFGAALHVLHVVENTNPTGGWTAGKRYTPPPASLTDGVEHEVRSELQSMIDKRTPRVQKSVLVVKTGSPLVEIVRYAAEQHVDLIVMGTHGHGPIAHMLLGSVADNVIRRAPCPVLTVRHPGHAELKTEN